MFVQALGDKPIHLQLTIIAVAELNPMLLSFPEQVDFGIMKSGNKVEREVIIKRYNESPVLFKEISNLSDLLCISVVNIDTDPKTIKLLLTLDSTNLPKGDYNTNVMFLTTHSVFSKLEIPLKANIIEDDFGFIPFIFIERLAKEYIKSFSVLKRDINQDIEIIDIVYEGDTTLEMRRIINDQATNDWVSVVRTTNLPQARIAKGQLIVKFRQKGGQEKISYVNLTAFLPAS